MNIFLRNLSLNDANDFFYAAWDEKVFHFLPGFYCDSLKQAKDTIKSLLSTKNVTAHVIASEENPFIGVIVAVKKETQEEKGKGHHLYPRAGGADGTGCEAAGDHQGSVHSPER